MNLFKRRRLIVWLLKAYLKRWGKIAFISFLIGLAVFGVLFFNRKLIISKIPFANNTNIGLYGSYTRDELPDEITNKISYGLTRVSVDGKIKPGAAQSWQIKDNGKTYVFFLKDGLKFNNGNALTSKQVNYNFEDALTEKPNPRTIIFKLKESYAPFLVTVGRGIYEKGFTGIGDYKVSKVKYNSDFIQSMRLTSIKNSAQTIDYSFYPTEEALKTAFVLGEVSTIQGVEDLNFKGRDIGSFKKVKVTKGINQQKLVTAFYNNQDPLLSDKKLRKALSYALPDNFDKGQRSYGSFPPDSWANTSTQADVTSDVEYAKTLLSQSSASSSGKLTVTLKTLPQYEEVAKTLSSSWKKLGIVTKIEVVESVPSQFQIFLGEFIVPKDPDQYILWHSTHPNNISKYKNLRIDKLLEDGRRTTDTAERRKIYADFQKYLHDDAPASFLYFPYSYTVARN